MGAPVSQDNISTFTWLIIDTVFILFILHTSCYFSSDEKLCSKFIISTIKGPLLCSITSSDFLGRVVKNENIILLVKNYWASF